MTDMNPDNYTPDAWERLGAALAAWHVAAGLLGQFAERYRREGAAQAASTYPAVEHHLDDCSECWADVCELIAELRLETAAEQAPAAPDPREPVGARLRAFAQGWLPAFPLQYSPALTANRLSGTGAAPTDRRQERQIVPTTGWRLRTELRPSGAGTYELALRLTDPQDEPLADIAVELSQAGGRESRRTITDQRGLATFAALPAGTLTTSSLRLGNADG